MSSKVLVASAIAGVTTPLVLSPIPEVSTIKFMAAYLAANVSLLFYLIKAQTPYVPFVELLLTVIIDLTKANLIFLLTSITLTLVRRYYFSPLSHFPGPKLAALSKLWLANQYRLGITARTYRHLHNVYKSDIIRIGPNDLSISCVEAVEKIYRGRYKRGTFYEVGTLSGEFNINSIRDHTVHGPWRRIW